MRTSRLRRFVTTALAVSALSVAGAPEVSAAPKNAEVKTCDDGTVIFTTNGQSVWAGSGDAKYQLIRVDGSGTGLWFDKKSDAYYPFEETISQTWGSDKLDATLTCTGHDHIEWTTGPNKGSSFDLDFTAQLRQV